MAFAQGAVTRTPYVVGDDEFLILTWTDLESAVASEGTITGLPKLWRMKKWKATASASTVRSRFTTTTGAAVGAHDDLGSITAAAAAQLNLELDALMETPAGVMFYKDLVAAGTATVQHTMIVKAGS